MNHANLLDRLLKQLEARGLSVTRGDRPGELFLHGPNEEKTPAIIEALKAFKPQLIERFNVVPASEPEPDLPRDVVEPEPETVICRVCSKDLSDPETRERMKDALYCDRGGAREVRTKNGTVIQPEEPQCPWK